MSRTTFISGGRALRLALITAMLSTTLFAGCYAGESNGAPPPSADGDAGQARAANANAGGVLTGKAALGDWTTVMRRRTPGGRVAQSAQRL